MRTPGPAAPLVYFDIVGAYGTMNGSIEIELATRILVPKPDGSTEVKFISSGRLRCTQNAATNLRNGAGCGIEDAGAAASQRGGDCGGEAELSAVTDRRHPSTAQALPRLLQRPFRKV